MQRLMLVILLTAGVAWGGSIVLAEGGEPGNAAFLTPIDGSTTSTCDSGLTLASNDPYDAAKAIDLCDSSLLTATWVMANGDPAVVDPDYHLGHGILSGFGHNVFPQAGAKLLALSSGTARQPTDPNYVAPIGGFDKGYLSSSPAGFPVAVFSCLGACPTTDTPHDDIALELALQVPNGANGFSFTYKFYAVDYPDFTCSTYNDVFLALVSPAPAGTYFGNVVADSNNQPISINLDSVIQVCSAASCYTCPLGTNELSGTGFEGHGATPWLSANVRATGGAVISIRFTVYDSGDGIYDSTALIDNFQWLYPPTAVDLSAAHAGGAPVGALPLLLTLLLATIATVWVVTGRRVSRRV